MRMALTCTVATFLCVAVGETRGNVLIYQLPKDGSWVRYNFAMTGDQAGLGASGTLMISSVGQTTENGEKCRWIEIKFIGKISEQEVVQVLKLLIPEQHQHKGKKPHEHVIKGWMKDGGSDPEKLSDSEHKFLVELLLGPLEDVKKLEKKKVVDYQEGQFRCEVEITGRKEFDVGPVKMHFAFSIWPHKEVPFGVAAVKMKQTARSDGKVLFTATTELSLAEIGTNATTALPENE